MTGTIAEVTFPADEFALKQTFQMLDTVRFDIEQVVAYNTDWLMPFVWAGTSNHEALESAFAEDDTVRDFRQIAAFNTECLYQLQWDAETKELIDILVEEQGTILTAAGKENRWRLQLLFGNHDAVVRTNEHCQKRGIDLEIENVRTFPDSRSGRFGLTQNQQHTLRLAYDRGYYSVPRRTSATNLAEEIGVTHQSLSERLRRGHANLVKNTLVVDH